MFHFKMGENKMLHIIFSALAAITLTITTLLPSSLPIFSAEEKYPFTVEMTGNGTATVSYDKIEKTFTDNYEAELASDKDVQFYIEGTDSSIEEVTVNGIELPDFEAGYLRRKFTVTTEDEATTVKIQFKSTKTSSSKTTAETDSASETENEITSYSPEGGVDVDEIMETTELEGSPVDLEDTIDLKVIQVNNGGSVTVNKTTLSKAGDEYEDKEASPYFALSIVADDGYVLADITNNDESLSESLIRTDNYTSWENAFLLTQDAEFKITFKKAEETSESEKTSSDKSAVTTSTSNDSITQTSADTDSQASATSLSESDMSYYMNLQPTYALATSDSQQSNIELLADRDWRTGYDGAAILETARSTNTTTLWTPYDSSGSGALQQDPSKAMDCSQWASYVYAQHGFKNVKHPEGYGYFCVDVRVTTWSWQTVLEQSPAVAHTSSNSTVGANPGCLIQFFDTSGSTNALSAIHAGIYVGKEYDDKEYMINDTHYVTIKTGTTYIYKGVKYTNTGDSYTFEAAGVIELPIECITEKGSSRVGSWWIYITTEETNGEIVVTKTSTKATLTSSSAAYSLSGAIYGIYSDSSCNTKVGQVTTGSNGVSNALSVAAGTYYIKEISPPTGFKISTTVKTVTVTASNTSNVNMSDEPRTGSIQIQKKSSNTSITNGNNCYSLEGATYGVYSDSSCKNSVGTLTIGSDGYSNTLTGLAPATYYIKETKAPKGYALDTTVHNLTVEFDKTATATYSDTPQTDPVQIMLGKVDKETNKNKPQGSATLANAQFTVKFYAGTYDDGVDPAKLGKTATRTWVLKTDSDGYCRLGSSYKVSGDAFYTQGGIVTLPIGTVTIQETKAPTGYIINNTVYVRKVTSSGTGVDVNTYNYPTVPEQVNEFKLYKYQQYGTTKYAIPNVQFKHTKPNGTTETLTTGSNGYITLKGLETGTHTFVETKAVDGYEINTNTITITVKADGTIQQDTTDLAKKGLSYDSSTYTMSVKDEVSPFDIQIIKKNEKGKLLEGAEFTIYTDANCTKVYKTLTTDSKGVLDLSGLSTETYYYIKETKAPQGYRIPLTNGSVRVYSLYVESVPVKNIFNVTVDGTRYTASSTDTTKEVYVTGTAKERTIHFNVINYTTAKLPETGSNYTIIAIAVGLGLMIIAMIGIQAGKKKKETGEN